MASLYKVYSRHFFRGAPVTKLLSVVVLLGSCLLIPYRRFRQHLIFTPEFLDISLSQWLDKMTILRFVFSKVLFIELGSVISGSYLLYCLRVIERRCGSRKFLTFIAVSSVISTVVEALCAATLFPIAYFATGPYSLLAAIMTQFVLDIPYVKLGQIGPFPITSKNLPYLLSVQLLISSQSNLFACLSGMLSGLVWRQFLSSIDLIPRKLAELAHSTLEPLLMLAEDKTGTILPMGATIEAQRNDMMDRYEQRLIYEQMRRQYLSDVQQASDDPTVPRSRHFWTRMFGASQSTSAVPSDRVDALLDMGLTQDRSRAEDVLRRANLDLSRAANIILAEGNVSN